MAARRSVVEREMIALLPRLRRFALALCKTQDVADDLVQETCERAITRAEQFEEGTRLDRWMFSIMSSRWKNHLRSQKVRAADSDDEVLTTIIDERESGRAERLQALSEVERALLRLPLDQRETLMLTSIEGLSYREAAETLDVAIGTVMSRVSRARLTLAGELGAGA
ncbi:MAG: RNA polymerase sigma factor [Pseudomonadota bacterium]